MNESNKRWETDADGSGKMQLYYSPVDRRIHLRGAERGAMNLDRDYDNKIDARVTYADTDDDGVFDSWSYDADADGKPDRTYKAAARAVPVRRRYPEITNVYRAALAEALERNQQLIDVMKQALGDRAISEAEDWFVNRRPTEFYHPDKLLWSPEATRYYQDVIREELFTRLLAEARAGRLELDVAAVESTYAEGRFAATARRIREDLELPRPAGEPWLEVPGVTFTKRLRIGLRNPINQDRPSSPVVVQLPDVLAAAPDFNPACFAVAETRRRIVTRQLPSQADDLDGDGSVDELVFLVQRLPGAEQSECFLYYCPSGAWRGQYRRRTHARDKIGASVGWESELAAFRSYYGKVDFFSKKVECLRLDDLGAYHQDADWGMDVLHIGPAPGLGGVSLWIGDEVYRAFNEEGKPPRCKISQRVASDGPVRSAVEIRMSGLKAGPATYEISLIASAYAGQLYSEHRLSIKPASAAADGAPLISPGLVVVPKAKTVFDAQTGTLSTWGRQDLKIGYFGQALIVPPGQLVDRKTLPSSEELRLRVPESGRTTFFVAAEWERCRTDQRRLVAKTAPEWARHVRRLAERVHGPIKVEMLDVESRERTAEEIGAHN